jgi:hypothetical protein
MLLTASQRRDWVGGLNRFRARHYRLLLLNGFEAARNSA